MRVELTLLGTGTPTPLLKRAGSSYLVSVEGQRLLFDCGPQCVRRLLEKGVALTEISGLFLTHLHYDHCVDYGYLVLSRWDHGVGKIPDLQVVGPSPLNRMTDLLFGEQGVYGPDLAARTQHPGSEFIYEMRGGVLPRERPQPSVTEVENGSVVAGSHWRVRVAEVVHCQPQLACLAYRLDADGKPKPAPNIEHKGFRNYGVKMPEYKTLRDDARAVLGGTLKPLSRLLAPNPVPVLRGWILE